MEDVAEVVSGWRYQELGMLTNVMTLVVDYDQIARITTVTP